jgi:signal transduction histidine kinase
MGTGRVEYMHEVLFDHFLTRFEVLVLLFLAAGAGGVLYWVWRKRWQSKLETMEQELARIREKTRIPEPQTEDESKLNAFRHSDLLPGLIFIATKGAETLDGLEEDQIVLREKQDLIIAKAQELLQSARNALDLSEPEEGELEKELLNVKGLVEMVLRELYLYAHSKGVKLLASLADVEPTMLERYSTSDILRNIIHNAIKYSFRGGVVETVLSIRTGMLEGSEKAICIDVKDTGKGIPKEQQDKIFGRGVRGHGSIEPGRGLGLYLARRAARRQGGDVILVRSSPNQGTVIRILLPYGGD